MLHSPVELIDATVQVEQPLPTADRTVGTGFLISSTAVDGSPETVLVTANHVLARMPGQEAKIGFRSASAAGAWSYTPKSLRIRNAAGAPLWTRHPSHDVAAIRISAPPEFARAAIPARYLVRGDTGDPTLSPGDELMVLGYPRGLAANPAGFPILRSGRVASYPLEPGAFPTFLLDFTVFPGNSGGPVFALERAQVQSGRSTTVAPYIAGLLTQQVEVDRERLEIGVVTHAKYVAETLDLLEGKATRGASGRGEAAAPQATPVSEAPRIGVFIARCLERLRYAVAELALAVQRIGYDLRYGGRGA